MKPTTLRARRRDATARSVLAAAREAFETAGFEGANVRAIAARAGVSAGTVLHHYGDKRELLHAALYEWLEQTLARARRGLGGGPLEADLSQLGGAVLRAYQRRPALSRTLLRESLLADGPWAQRFAAQVATVHAQVAALAREAVARGELRPDTDVALLGAAWFSFYFFALVSWAQGAHPAPARLLERLTAQHLAGLRPTGARRRR